MAKPANAYEEAAKTKVAIPAEEGPGLHNVRRLGDNIVSGSEPHGEEAIAAIAKMGVKTILSVDGKVPDAATAGKYGIKYVHIPIKYSGISDDEVAEIAKTFREQEGPFYVHCFHGKHRGPAGAAIGRLVLDGIPREQAIAEMRECGTSGKYEGLYQTIATKSVPSTRETKALAFSFPAAHPFGGFRETMVGMPRSFDALKAFSASGWKPDPESPDLDPLNEAEKLHDLFVAGKHVPDTKSRPQDFQEWLQQAIDESDDLVRQVRAMRAGDAAAMAKADKSVAAISKTCNACHGGYRD
jgi:protein tyrosine phosphatase (PTP) superfamily phosphohydrolase (DUF442 family)